MPEDTLPFYRKPEIFTVYAMLLFWTTACNAPTGWDNTQPTDTTAQHVVPERHPPLCYTYLTELVRSSNFPFGAISKDKINILIDEDRDSVIRMKLFFDIEGSGTIGWAEYLVQEQKLLNTSADLGTPQELVFNKKFARDYQQCLGSSNSTVTCTEFEVEMGKGTRCFYPNQILESVYAIILKEYRSESKHLLLFIPERDTAYDSSKEDEDVHITYTISRDKTDIDLEYPGGVTEINLTQEANHTTTRVIYNAD